MHVFHIRGFSGWLVLLLAVVAALVLLLVLPSTFMMVLWNALVFEGFKGTQIGLYEGCLLWGMVAVALQLTFKPKIQLQFQSAKSAAASKSNPPDASAIKAEQAEESDEAAAPVLDNQQKEG